MEIKNIQNVKANFAEYIFLNSEQIKVHVAAKEGILIYFLFKEMLEHLTEPNFIENKLDLSKMKDEQKFTMYFKNDKNLEIKLTVIYLIEKDGNKFLINCLKQKKDIYMAEIKIFNQKKDLDEYLLETSNTLQENILNNIYNIKNYLKQKERKQNEEKNKNRQNPYTNNNRPNPQRPYPNYNNNPYAPPPPFIRYDPPFPPGLGIPYGGPFGGNNNNNRGRGRNNNGRGRGGFGRGNPFGGNGMGGNGGMGGFGGGMGGMGGGGGFGFPPY